MITDVTKLMEIHPCDARVYGFCLISYPMGDCSAQRIYAFTTERERAVNWLKNGGRCDDFVNAVVAGYGL